MERRKFTREFKLEAVRLIRDRGVSYAQASEDLGVHQSQLRDWVKKFTDDPHHPFPGNGQMKPEQFEIARLKREVLKLKADGESPSIILATHDANAHLLVNGHAEITADTPGAFLCASVPSGSVSAESGLRRNREED